MIKCKVCGREFKNKQGLSMHMKTHTNESAINNLLERRRKTYDAHTRHHIDLEIMRLKEE